MKIIKQTSTQFTVKQDIPWSLWFWGVAWGFMGVLVAQEKSNVLASIVPLAVGLLPFFVFGQISICDFNANTGQFTIKRQGLLGTRQIQHPLSEIIHVEPKPNSSLAPSYKSSSETGYRIEIVLLSGKIVPLTNYFKSDYENQEKIANQIRVFLVIKPR
jgi:hypothetical protein